MLTNNQHTMSKIRRTAEFNMFMYEAGALQMFFENICDPIRISEGYINFVSRLSDSSPIIYAFGWRTTKQGSEFWKDLHYIWSKYRTPKERKRELISFKKKFENVFKEYC